MCTALHLTDGKARAVFGRTMDFHYDLDSHMYAISRGYSWKAGKEPVQNQYAVLGIGSGQTPALFDGVNEKGLAGAELYFPGYAHFEKPGTTGRKEIPAGHVLHCLLGTCASAADVRDWFSKYAVTEVKNPKTGLLLPVHWMFADAAGVAIVVEITQTGVHIYDNPVGVMTNSPEFPWHLTNLRNYMGAVPEQPEKAVWGKQELHPFGQGLAAGILPGGYAPPARFVRAAYGAAFASRGETERDLVQAGFHILESVMVPKGLVKTKEGRFDSTQYTAFVDPFQKRYYVRTYHHLNVRSISLEESDRQDAGMRDLGPLDTLPVDLAF